MTDGEFDEWAERLAQRYADSVVRSSGLPADVAVEQSIGALRQLLPGRVETPGMLLMVVVIPDGNEAGVLWVGEHPAHAGIMWVCDIFIEEAFRGRGVGRAAMQAAEGMCREAGFDELGLNVFGFNTPARRLYESLGYQTVKIEMIKNVSSAT
jgi:GNAT superfamily N-acetyltransferase